MSHLKPLVLAVIVLIQGCAGSQLQEDDSTLLLSVPKFALADWPYQEYWTGISFNDHKIGFSHLRIEHGETLPGTYLITSETSLLFQFFNRGKQVKLHSRDWVNPDLTINGFVYDYHLDGNRMKLYGVVRNNILNVVIDSSSGRVTESHHLTSPLYPISVINLYPAFHGLHTDTMHSYMVFDGESQRMINLSQSILGYEYSDQFEGKAWKVSTSMNNQDMTTWINSKAQPLLESSMQGMLIAGLKSEAMARHYLDQASLNKEENLLYFSLIQTDRPVVLPRQATYLEFELSGPERMPFFPVDERQKCIETSAVLRCRISGSSSPVGHLPKGQREAYLATSVAIPAQHPKIRNLASEITRTAVTEQGKIIALLDWMRNNIRSEAMDVFTALDVLEKRKGECQGHSLLFASFARSLGIPTRVVNGIIYSEQYPGFLYHTWVESLVDGHWQAIDPIFGQLHADATHIKMLEGDNPADVTPLLNLVGRLSAKIIAVDTD